MRNVTDTSISQGPAVGTRYLASGLLVEVDAMTRKATPVTCDWLVAVPTASLYPPEAEWYPDSPSDVYTEVPCGARVRRHPDHPSGTLCENGHDRLPMEIDLAPFGPQWQREQNERYAETGSYA
jgi:hypothetical protein